MTPNLSNDIRRFGQDVLQARERDVIEYAKECSHWEFGIV